LDRVKRGCSKAEVEEFKAAALRQASEVASEAEDSECDSDGAESSESQVAAADPYMATADLDAIARQEAEDEAALAELANLQGLEEAEPSMPPPSSVSSHKRRKTSSEGLAPAEGSGPASEPVEPEKDAETESEESSESSSNSDSEEGEEEEDAEEDIEEAGDEAEEAADPPEEGAEDAGGSTLQLYKLGARCCTVMIHRVGGSESSLQSRRLDIDQRVRLEHCRKHLQWAGDLATVWHFAATDPREKVAWEALCNYFVSRKRIGLAELDATTVYVVPPDDGFLSELGLPAAPGSLAGSLLALQVPNYDSEEAARGEADVEAPKEAEAKESEGDASKEAASEGEPSGVEA